MGLITLVRHGQASFGAADYDRLTTHGEYQAVKLGRNYARRDRQPDLIVSGTLRRQVETTKAMAVAAGWHAAPRQVTSAWDEYDHQAIMVGARAGVPRDARTFQDRLESALQVWIGLQDPDMTFGKESWPTFRERCRAGFESLLPLVGPGQWVVVVSSAGPIALTATRVLTRSHEAEVNVPLWLALTRVLINTSQSQIVVGRSGLNLLSFNEHQHLVSKDVTSR